ncbi:MAG: hypothetical protein R2932_47800 [Caldilineaceae bacterium]
MPAVEIAQHWVDELTGLQSGSTKVDMNQIVDVALQQYTYRQRQEKIARERQWYEAHHAEIVQEYMGRYIAVHNGQIIDSDIDGAILSKRLRQEYGRVAIAIIHVDATPDLPTLHLRSPKLMTNR